MATIETEVPNQPALSQREQSSWKEHSTGISSVSLFLTNSDGKLLMVQDTDEHGGKWAPIAGYIDDLDNEEPEAAALREAKEELDLEVVLEKLIGVWHYYDQDSDRPDKPRMHLGYAFAGRIMGGTFSPQAEELQNWGFFTPEEVEQLHVEGKLKTPQYTYRGFQLWKEKAFHPLTVIQANGSIRRSLPSINVVVSQ